MICNKCAAEGLKSTIQGPNDVGETLMGWSPFYDKEGVYHEHNRNTTRYRYKCSNGHTFRIETRKGCPAPGCDFIAQTSDQIFTSDMSYISEDAIIIKTLKVRNNDEPIRPLHVKYNDVIAMGPNLQEKLGQADAVVFTEGKPTGLAWENTVTKDMTDAEREEHWRNH